MGNTATFTILGNADFEITIIINEYLPVSSKPQLVYKTLNEFTKSTDYIKSILVSEAIFQIVVYRTPLKDMQVGVFEKGNGTAITAVKVSDGAVQFGNRLTDYEFKLI